MPSPTRPDPDADSASSAPSSGLDSGLDSGRADSAPTREAGPRLAVIIPMFRAEAHIAEVIRGIPARVPLIVVVDDCSDDRSGEIVTSLGDERVTLLRHESNQGVGGATLTGYRHASELGAEILIKMDADGQMDPAALPALVRPIVRGEADYTKGNRFLHARELQGMPLKRRVGNLGLSFLTKMASGYWRVFDPTNGYTALHANVFRALDTERIDKRYFFETSMLLELSLHRAVVRDVFIPARYGTEKSNLSEFRSLLGFPPRQLRGFRRRLWHQHVMRDFGLLPVFLITGVPLFLFGFFFGAYHWYIAFATGVVTSAGTVMLSVLPIIIGIQFMLQAVTLDVQAEPKRPQHPDLQPDPWGEDSTGGAWLVPRAPRERSPSRSSAQRAEPLKQESSSPSRSSAS